MNEMEMIQKLESVLATLRPADQRFAGSMIDQHKRKGSLSEKQWHWVKKLAGLDQSAEDGKRFQAKHTRQVGDMSALTEMLRHAKEHLKFPKLYLETEAYAVQLTCNHCGYNLPIMQRRADETVEQLLQRMPIMLPCPSGDGGTMVARPIGHPVRVALAGPRSRYEGQIMVTDGGPWGENVWYGRIDENGGWFVPPAAQGLHEITAVETLLMAMATHPVETAASHGKLHGNCCFCGNELSDPTSTDLGYGPTCAKNYGLKWKKTQEAA